MSGINITVAAAVGAVAGGVAALVVLRLARGDGARAPGHAADADAQAGSSLVTTTEDGTSGAGGAGGDVQERVQALLREAHARVGAAPLPAWAAFPTVVGRQLMSEIRCVAAPHGGTLVVTNADLWPLFRAALQGEHMLDVPRGVGADGPRAGGAAGRRPYLVGSLEASMLEDHLARLTDGRVAPTGVRCVVGVGGGTAIDVAKWFAWRMRVPLFLVPTALSVDAAFGHRSAIRFDGNVRYVGFAVPEAVYIDVDVLRKAPRLLSLSGVGDVLCYHTAHFDWALAQVHGKQGNWPFAPGVAAQARAVLDALVARIEDVRDMSDAGIKALVDALAYGGAAYHAHGWNPRPVEGYEHLFFYCLEFLTGRKFLHGQPVMLGVLLGSLLQNNRVAWVCGVLKRLGVDIRPEAMGITWDDVRSAVLHLPAYARKEGYMFTIADVAEPDDAFFARAKELVEEACAACDQ